MINLLVSSAPMNLSSNPNLKLVSTNLKWVPILRSLTSQMGEGVEFASFIRPIEVVELERLVRQNESDRPREKTNLIRSHI